MYIPEQDELLTEYRRAIDAAITFGILAGDFLEAWRAQAWDVLAVEFKYEAPHYARTDSIAPGETVPAGATLMPSSFTLEDAITECSHDYSQRGVANFLKRLEAMTAPLTIETDGDGYILEGAMQNGFETIDNDGSLYVVHGSKLIDYVKKYRDFIPEGKMLVSREALHTVLQDPVIKARFIEILTE